MAKLQLPHWLRRYTVRPTLRGWQDANTNELYVSRKMKQEEVEEWESENNKTDAKELKAYNEAARAKPSDDRPAEDQAAKEAVTVAPELPFLAKLKSGEVDIGDYTDNLYSKTKAELLDEAKAVGYKEAKAAQNKDEILDGLIGYLSDIVD